jgi:hypothetical protein
VSPTTARTRRPVVDQVCAEAVDMARAAAEELAGPDQVGEHLDVVADADRVVTHLFACRSPGYRGWRWAVTVARASRARAVTLDETALLPGPDALLAPEWLPWSDRLRPGDVGVGDLLPSEEDDERLVPGYTGADDSPDVAEFAAAVGPWLAHQLGLGRARVLSREGRHDAAERWYAGDAGPLAPVAKVAPAACSTCGYFVPLGGALGQAFGACANELSPSEGRVVAADHGCGAHSEAARMPALLRVAPPVVDEMGYDDLALRPAALHPAPRAPGSVDDAEPVEDLGHS